MLDRRFEPRMLCADIVDIRWEDPKTGRLRHTTGNLDDISKSGACLLIDCIIPAKTPLQIAHSRGELTGKVIYWVWQELGYVIGVRFDPDCPWSQENYQPPASIRPLALSDLPARSTPVSLKPFSHCPIARNRRETKNEWFERLRARLFQKPNNFASLLAFQWPMKHA
jgi:hypothetical protein